jgi:uncharacterized membrane protein
MTVLGKWKMKKSLIKIPLIIICLLIIISTHCISIGMIQPNVGAKDTQSFINDELNRDTRSSRSILLSAEKLVDTIEPGQKKINTLSIENDGLDSTFSITADYWPKNWGIELEHDELLINSMYELYSKLYITAPWDDEVSDSVTIEITVRDKNDQSIYDDIVIEYSLNITVDFEIEVLMETLDDPQDSLNGKKAVQMHPRDMMTVELRIKNKGNINDSYDLSLTGKIYDYRTYFIETGLSTYYNSTKLDASIMANQFPSVYSGNQNILKFKVSVSDFMINDEINKITVKAISNYSHSSDDIKEVVKYDSFYIRGNESLNLEMKCVEQRKYVHSGADAIFEFMVYNYIGLDITVDLLYSSNYDDWDIQLYDENNLKLPSENAKINVRSESMARIMVSVGVPPKLKAGVRKNVLISGSTPSGTNIISTDTIAFTAIVRQIFDLNVTVSPPVIHAEPGKVATYNISFENKGNGDDFVIIRNSDNNELSGIFYFNGSASITETVYMNETVTFQTRVLIPNNQIAGNYSIIVNVSSMGNKESVELFLEVIGEPDVEIVDVEESRTTVGFAESEVLVINATVKNTGNIPVENITVGLYHNNEIVGTIRVTQLDRNQSTVVKFYWEISGGKHRINIRLDPSNDISEKNESNNEWITDLEFNETSDGNKTDTTKKDSNISLYIGIIIVIIVIILLILILIIRNRRNNQPTQNYGPEHIAQPTQQQPNVQQKPEYYSQQLIPKAQENKCERCYSTLIDPDYCSNCGWRRDFY